MALNKTARSIVATATSNAAGATTRGTLDTESAYGGLLTIKITNGATGPTVACTCNILVAHNASLPAAASRGADWKTIYTLGGSLVANDITEFSMPIDIAVMALEVEFTGNTGQAVTVEAQFSEVSSY